MPVKADDRDKVMFNDPDEWPCWPYLPVKRIVGHQTECGFVYGSSVHSDGKVRVYTVYVADCGKGRKYESPQVTPCKEYGSVDEMMQDGWIVD